MRLFLPIAIFAELQANKTRGAPTKTHTKRQYLISGTPQRRMWRKKGGRGVPHQRSGAVHACPTAMPGKRPQRNKATENNTTQDAPNRVELCSRPNHFENFFYAVLFLVLADPSALQGNSERLGAVVKWAK